MHLSSDDAQQNGDRIGLDFAVIGFPKTGTTFLKIVLEQHPKVKMHPGEFCQIHGDDGDKPMLNWLQNVSSMALPGQKYGIKCPSLVRDTDAIDNLVKLSDHTRLVVGVRHPLLWFQSFYNYR